MKFWFLTTHAAVTVFTFLVGEAMATGGSTVGNGGDAVVCRFMNREIQSAETLDLYEARTVRGIRWSVPGELDNPGRILDFVMDRFAKVDAKRAEIFRKRLAAFEGEANFTDEVLADVPDHGVLDLKPACAVEQFVVQKEPRFPEDKRYLVQAKIWRHLKDKQNFLQLAAVMLHEVVYTEFIARGHTSSESARYFNSALFAGTLNRLSREQYVALLDSLRLGLLP